MTDNTAAAGDPDDAMHAFAELALITVNADPAEQTLRRVAETGQTHPRRGGGRLAHRHP